MPTNPSNFNIIDLYPNWRFDDQDYPKKIPLSVTEAAPPAAEVPFIQVLTVAMRY